MDQEELNQAGRKMKSLSDRFWLKVSRIGLASSPDCWIWIGQIARNGYGRIKEGSRGSVPLYAHRVSFSIKYGEILPGFDVHHECHNKACVNPKHLKLVDHVGHNSNGQFQKMSVRPLEVT